nr:hypothetical protein L204_06515 [Cryptococcus depauperatus CBS 7855]
MAAERQTPGRPFYSIDKEDCKCVECTQQALLVHPLPNHCQPSRSMIIASIRRSSPPWREYTVTTLHACCPTFTYRSAMNIENVPMITNPQIGSPSYPMLLDLTTVYICGATNDTQNHNRRRLSHESYYPLQSKPIASNHLPAPDRNISVYSSS